MSNSFGDSEVSLLVQQDKKYRLEDPRLETLAPQDSSLWRAAHAGGFILGGTTFIIGTALLFPPLSDENSLSSAVLYIVGSAGFLTVDLLELCVYKECPLRGNISLSAAGSAAYVIGSAGYIPALSNRTGALGPLGFIIGSAVIAVSQLWKLVRIATPEDGQSSASLSYMFQSKDRATATGVEGGACVGAIFFLVGTALLYSPSVSSTGVLILWMVGSVAFTVGSAFLTYRHAWLHL